MNDKPILFNTEMVKAIINGRKTQTRRPISKRDNDSLNVCDHEFTVVWNTETMDYIRSSFRAGDILYVRETSCPLFLCIDEESGYTDEVIECSYRDEKFKREIMAGDRRHVIAYKSDGTDDCFCDASTEDRGFKWVPSIHMPKWASRIKLRVKEVRAEYAAEITEEDAKADGFENRKEFLASFKAIYGRTDLLCWVIEFEVIEKRHLERTEK